MRKEFLMDDTSNMEIRFKELKEKVAKLSSQKSALESRVQTLEEQKNEILIKMQKEYGIKDIQTLQKTVTALSQELEKRIGQAEEALDKIGIGI